MVGALSEAQQPEPRNPDLDAKSLKAAAVAQFSKTGSMNPLVSQTLADL